MSVTACGGWLAALLTTGTWLLWQRWAAARNEAVARACHELRGPLTAARLGLELGSRGQSLSSAQLRAIGSELRRASLALEDLAGVGSRRVVAPALELVDLDGLVGDSVEAWRPSAGASGVQLRLGARSGGALVPGDRVRLAQAVGNLIANAIEHGGDEVEVRISAKGEEVRVEVIDDGPGLPASVETLARRARGGRGARGRGLAIAAGIAALHRGRLVAAEPERGARVALVLPAA